MKLAVRWEVKVEGDKRSIQLFDKKGNRIDGRGAYWDGSFYCSNNNLTSLEGSPENVGGSFYCSNNNLTSLEGSPENVGGSFYCYDNNLTSLEGSPEIVGGRFYCSNNNLTSLEGSPEIVGGRFYCYDNNLTSLEGSPEIVGGSFYCYDNNLTSLEGSPEIVGGSFYCYNNNLTSLEGSPEIVGGSFYCSNNNLTSLEGSPEIVGGRFYCYNNNLTSLEGSPEENQEWTKDLVRLNMWAKGILWADGIMSHIVKQRGDIYKVIVFGQTKESYVIHQDGNFSHGETLKQARDSLVFKVSKRDTSEFKGWDIETKRGLSDLISAYRSVTGACESGVKMFCDSTGIKPEDKYSIKEVIKLTKGRYHSEMFAKFFEEEE